MTTPWVAEMKLESIFHSAIEEHASDVHFVSGEIPRMRVEGKLVPLGTEALQTSDLWTVLEPIYSSEAQALIRAGHRVERSKTVEGVVFNGVGFRLEEDGAMITFRLLANLIPSLADIGSDALPLLEEIGNLNRGLVVISGQTGSGKWTTVSALVEHINQTLPSRIFTICSRPSYVYRSKTGLITDIHVGRDCATYKDAMEIARESDPDVIAVDDLSSEELLREALHLADTRRLVIANLHAQDSRDAIRTLMNFGGEDRKSLHQVLAANLVTVTGQQLVQRSDRPGRVAAYDWLKIDSSVKELVRNSDLAGLKVLTSDSAVSRSRRDALQNLVRQGIIKSESANGALRA